MFTDKMYGASSDRPLLDETIKSMRESFLNECRYKVSKALYMGSGIISTFYLI